MAIPSELKNSRPVTLIGARNMAHSAVQLVTMAARANLPAVPDDSHANLGWDKTRGAFVTHPIAAGGEDLFIALTLANLTLQIIKAGQTTAGIELAGVTRKDAFLWLDTQLEQTGLSPASPVSSLYDVPSVVAEISTYSTTDLIQPLAALGAWFALADSLLADFAAAHSDIRPGPSAVRCWPHHFDIATYVSLQAGTSAPAVGVGMSPGDDYYEQPYFYVNPWPNLAADDLPDLPAPGRWHTHDFVGAVATGEDILSLSDVSAGLAGFIDETFAIGRRQLGV